MAEKKKRKKSVIGTILKIIAFALAFVILVAGGYVAYVFIAFHRIGDYAVQAEGSPVANAAQTGVEYKIVSYNIGFGAYEVDYDFFMDGGTQSRAVSKERLDANLNNIAAYLKAQNADLYIIQEVDIGSTRSYNLDEREYLTSALENKSYIFGQNYDSPYLFYPVTCPHGASKSGIMTFSFAEVKQAERIELPIETGVSKLLDLDRCYTKSRVSVEGGKDLVIYNFHLSAYTTDGTIATEQLNKVLADMQSEYEAGNYVVGGGDFNKDLLGDMDHPFGDFDIEYTWAQPIPEGTFDGYSISLSAPFDSENKVPSCRNADAPYHAGQFVITIDGFLVSDNVTAVSSAVLDTGFLYSDHNPVEMTFILN